MALDSGEVKGLIRLGANAHAYNPHLACIMFSFVSVATFCYSTIRSGCNRVSGRKVHDSTHQQPKLLKLPSVPRIFS